MCLRWWLFWTWLGEVGGNSTTHPSMKSTPSALIFFRAQTAYERNFYCGWRCTAMIVMILFNFFWVEVVGLMVTTTYTHPSNDSAPLASVFFADANCWRAQFLLRMAPHSDDNDDFVLILLGGGGGIDGGNSIHPSIKWFFSPSSCIPLLLYFSVDAMLLSSPVSFANGTAMRWWWWCNLFYWFGRRWREGW